MPEELIVPFVGPFSWPGVPDAPSVFDVKVSREPGIYLWTVPLQNGHLVWYVGETGRKLRIRLLEHYQEHAACMYHVYSPAEFARGEKIMVWPGRYDPADRKTVQECIAQYSRMSQPVEELTHLYRFFLAPLHCEDRVRLRIEAAIAKALYDAPGLAGAFQERGIRYVPRKDNEEPVACMITTAAPFIGMPERLSA
jgi:hypothetical protein